MKTRKREILIILVLIAGAILFKLFIQFIPTWFGGPSVNTATLPLQSGHVTVTMSNRIFHADAIAVTVGTTVTWVNHDPMAHTVTEGQGAKATPHGFNSGVMNSGQSWSNTFTTPGTYLYTCLFHSDMNGRVIVRRAT
jgi:plastocyanin